MEIKLIVAVKLLFVVLVVVENSRAIRWLALHRSSLPWNVTSLTGKVLCQEARIRYGLGRRQSRLCREAPETMPHVTSAASTAVDTCTGIFASRRWNCSAVKLVPDLTPDLTRGTREQGYVYALSSASLTHSMSRACSSGALHQCTCALPPNEPSRADFKWGGCGDNVRWASRFAKQFTDSLERHPGGEPSVVTTTDGHKRDVGSKSDAPVERRVKRMQTQISAMNLHNNRLGRRLVEQSLQIQCKCHGVSGSCNIKTCWRALPSMTEIGTRLQRRFISAIEVSGRRLNAIGSRQHVPTSDQLIYITKSPDYCTRDDRLGSVGTKGRICNVSSSGTDSCRYMCCGRGYRTVVEEKIERCHCKYYWCCYVKCKTCRTLIQTHECN